MLVSLIFFFTERLQAWKANISSKQPVVNHYDVVTYMCAYFSKSEDETFEVMKHTAKECTLYVVT